MNIEAKLNPAIAAIEPAKRSITNLPFITVRLKRGREKIDWWCVRSTGHEYEDEIIGGAYAVEALQFLLTPGQEHNPLLYHIFAAIGKKKHAAIERGFINTLVGYARRGAEATALPIPHMESEEVEA